MCIRDSFTPREISVPASKLVELRYDVKDDDQVVELAPQDIILSEDCGEWLLRVSKFIDDLLVKYYKRPPYYEADSKEELIGALVICLLYTSDAADDLTRVDLGGRR